MWCKKSIQTCRSKSNLLNIQCLQLSLIRLKCPHIHIYIKIYYHIHSCLHSSIAFFCICPAHCLFTLWWSAITAPAELRWDAIQRLRQRAVGSHREKMCFGVPWVVSAVWCFIDASCLICAFDVHLTYLFYLIFCPCPWSVVQHCPALPSIAQHCPALQSCFSQVILWKHG